MTDDYTEMLVQADPRCPFCGGSIVRLTTAFNIDNNVIEYRCDNCGEYFANKYQGEAA